MVEIMGTPGQELDRFIEGCFGPFRRADQVPHGDSLHRAYTNRLVDVSQPSMRTIRHE